MKTTIVLGSNRMFPAEPLSHQNREFEYFESAEQAYLYHLDQPDVDSYLIDLQKFDREVLINIVRHINFLNEIVSVFLFDPDGRLDSTGLDGKNLQHPGSLEELVSGLQSIPEISRKYSRVTWPVAATFWDGENPEEKNSGMVISISSGGCLIQSGESLVPGTPIIMTIIFKDFDFLAEGTVVRLEARGFAVQFKNISSQTQNIIQEIVNEKILVELEGLN